MNKRNYTFRTNTVRTNEGTNSISKKNQFDTPIY